MSLGLIRDNDAGLRLVKLAGQLLVGYLADGIKYVHVVEALLSLRAFDPHLDLTSCINLDLKFVLVCQLYPPLGCRSPKSRLNPSIAFEIGPFSPISRKACCAFLKLGFVASARL